MRARIPTLLTLVLILVGATLQAANFPFAQRGYYMTFMRMPAFGLPEWKQMIDCIRDDGGNLLMLWTAGGFRSKRFPETWDYNRGHKNVADDFVKDLIDYAHTKGIRVLLCFTPFAYDGVNQYTIKRSSLRATGKDGKPTTFWGMHSWGYNLCPSEPESQRFMLEYVREMFFEFYPNADGLMIESSDYAICYCASCKEDFFRREFAFVRKISDEIWQVKSNAMITVYPHYFSGSKVPGFEVRAAIEKFDDRWTLFFTPHSAYIEPNLARQARDSIYSNEGLSLGTPAKIRDAAHLIKRHGLTGFVPSLEPFTCPTGPPDNPGAAMKPFHFDWLRDGEMPLNALPIRVNRVAYREYSRNPELSDELFRSALSQELFGGSKPEAVADVLFLQECCFQEAEWFKPPPLLAGKQKAKISPDKEAKLRERVARLKVIAERYATSTDKAEREMHRIASFIVHRWD